MKKFKQKKFKGSLKRPRVSIFRSNNHIYAQVIDDNKAHTLSSCSTLDKEIRSKIDKSDNCEAAYLVGKVLALRLKEQNILKLYFDRGKKKYHGRIAAIATALREEGLEV